MRVCLFTGDPCTGSKPWPSSAKGPLTQAPSLCRNQAQALASHPPPPPTWSNCSTWTSLYRDSPRHVQPCSLCSPHYRKTGGWHSTEMSSCWFGILFTDRVHMNYGWWLGTQKLLALAQWCLSNGSYLTKIKVGCLPTLCERVVELNFIVFVYLWNFTHPNCCLKVEKNGRR